MREVFTGIASGKSVKNTYKTKEGAVKKLNRVCDRMGFDRVRYMIGVTDTGRFYPIVAGCHMYNNDKFMMTSFIHNGIAVIA